MEFPIIATRYDYVNSFVNNIAPLVCNEWLKRHNNNEKTISPATCIAQASIESGYNLNAETLFGIKGSDLQLDTSEYIDGQYVNVTDSFKAFPSVAAAIEGYYDLMQWENYDDATSATTVEGELEGLTNDIGYPYATSPTYYQNCLDVINDFGFRVFNDFVYSYNVEIEQPKPSEVEEIDIKPGNIVKVATDDDGNVYDIHGTLCHCWFDEYEVVDTNEFNTCLAHSGIIFARLENSYIIRC